MSVSETGVKLPVLRLTRSEQRVIEDMLLRDKDAIITQRIQQMTYSKIVGRTLKLRITPSHIRGAAKGLGWKNWPVADNAKGNGKGGYCRGFPFTMMGELLDLVVHLCSKNNVAIPAEFAATVLRIQEEVKRIKSGEQANSRPTTTDTDIAGIRLPSMQRDHNSSH